MLTNKFSICYHDIYPDKNFLSNAKIDNLYYLEEDFNTMFVDKTVDKSSFLHFMQLLEACARI